MIRPRLSKKTLFLGKMAITPFNFDKFRIGGKLKQNGKDRSRLAKDRLFVAYCFLKAGLATQYINVLKRHILL